MERLNLLENIISDIGVHVERKVATAGAIKTNYLIAGKGQTTILLHGASAAGAVTWHHVIGPLSAHSQVIAPDIVGYGESDKPSAPYDMPNAQLSIIEDAGHISFFDQSEAFNNILNEFLT